MLLPRVMLAPLTPQPYVLLATLFASSGAYEGVWCTTAIGKKETQPVTTPICLL